MKPRPGVLRSIPLAIVVAGLWMALAAHSESSLLQIVPRSVVTGLTWSLPGVVGLVVLAVMLSRVSDALAAQYVQLARAQKEAARLASELEAVVDSLADPLVVLDSAGRIVRANVAFRRLIGERSYGRVIEMVHGLTGKVPFLREDGSPISIEQLPTTRALAGQVIVGETLVIKRGNQNHYFLVSAAPIRDPQTRAISGAAIQLRNISELKRLEKLKDEFISTTSHELRTPLAVIRGYAELQLLSDRRDSGVEAQDGSYQLDADRSDAYLAAETAGPAQPESFPARRIISEVDRMTGLVNQMLQIARLDAGRHRIQMRDCDLLTLTREELSGLSITTGTDRIGLETDDVEDPVICEVDPDAYRQILDNLVANAVKYSSEFQPIVVKVSIGADEATVSVIDRGIGISPEELPMVFEKFFRSKEVSAMDKTGLGLGLYITSRLVALQKGRIWVESEPGEGSAFHVAFPLVKSFQ